MQKIYKHPKQLYTNELLHNWFSVVGTQGFPNEANYYAKVALNNPSTKCQLNFII